MLKVEGVDLGLALAAAKSANALVTAAPTKLSTRVLKPQRNFFLHSRSRFSLHNL